MSENILQFGALGLLAIMIPVFGWLIKYIVKYLTNANTCLMEKNQQLVKDFKETIDNHLSKHTKIDRGLTEAIRALTKEIKNGKNK